MIPEKLYHATYKQFLKSIQQDGLGNTKNKMWEDSKSGVVYLANDPWVAESYAETSEWVDEQEDPDIYLDNIIILEIDTSKLDTDKLEIDKNVLLDEEEENATWEYYGVIPWEVCKIFDSSLQEWKSIDSDSEDFTSNFEKLVDHLKTIFGWCVIKLTAHILDVKLAFGYNRQQLLIQYEPKQRDFTVQIKDNVNNQIILDVSSLNNWDAVLTKLQEKGYIKDKKLCESISTIDEFKLYENLWIPEITPTEEKLIDLFWAGIKNYSSDIWFDSSTNEKEEILWQALEQLNEPIDKDRAIELFWDWADGLEEDSFIDF